MVERKRSTLLLKDLRIPGTLFDIILGKIVWTGTVYSWNNETATNMVKWENTTTFRMGMFTSCILNFN